MSVLSNAKDAVSSGDAVSTTYTIHDNDDNYSTGWLGLAIPIVHRLINIILFRMDCSMESAGF